MKKVHHAEIIYAGFDPAFEDVVILGAEINKLNLLNITLTSSQSILLLQGKCSKKTFQKRLSELEKDLRIYERGGKSKEFNVWTY